MSDGPFIAFYPSDWLAGTRGLTAVETGVYITLVAMMYERGDPLTQDHARLARLCGLPKASFARALSVLIDEGKIDETDNGLWNNRVSVELNRRQNIRDTASKAAKTRWQKSKENQRGVDADAMRTQCENDANQNQSITETNVSGADAPIDFAKAIFEHGVRFLVDHGTSEQSARTLIGKWRKSYDDREIFDAFKAAKQAGVTDPKSYIAAVLGGQHGKPADETDRLQRIVTAAARGSSGEDWG